MNPLVSVVVLSYNKRAYTKKCLESLASSTWRPMEIIVVDQGSTDGSREMIEQMKQTLAEQGIELRTIYNERNVGAPTGRNQAMDIARGEYLAFVDNDVVVKDRDWLEKLIACLEEDPRRAVVSPKLLFPPPMDIIEFAGCAVSPSGRVQYMGRGQPADDPRFNEPKEVQCLISACIVVPRRVIDDVGKMDEAYNPVQYEDLDWCYRMRSKGYVCYYLPTAEMYHYEHITTNGSEDINFKYVTIKNGLLFKRRWRHMFEKEGGPPDEETKWQHIERVRLEEQ